MTEMEAKILASIDSVKNEMNCVKNDINDVKAKQTVMKKDLANIEQVFLAFLSHA